MGRQAQHRSLSHGRKRSQHGNRKVLAAACLHIVSESLQLFRKFPSSPRLFLFLEVSAIELREEVSEP